MGYEKAESDSSNNTQPFGSFWHSWLWSTFRSPQQKIQNNRQEHLNDMNSTWNQENSKYQ